MKIAWVTDFKNQVGGAEKTEDAMISRAGKDFEIVKMTSQNFKGDFDYYVLNNFRTFTELQIEFLIENKNYIVYWHDSLGSPNWKLYEKVIENAKLNIFLSPLHKEKFVQFGFKLNTKNSICIAPYINVNGQLKHIPKLEERKEDVCWLGAIYHHKGIDNALMWAYHNDRKIDFYGNGDSSLIEQIKLSKYGEYKGTTHNPFEVLKKYKYFIHLPESEAFGRSYAEAILSGCKIIGNDNIGAVSWYKDNYFSDWKFFLKQQPETFWFEVAKVFNLFKLLCKHNNLGKESEGA